MTLPRLSLKARLICSAAVVAAIVMLVAPLYGYGAPLLIWNTGDSMPKGLWRYERPGPVHRGDVVVIRDPPHFDLVWLMKRVRGTEGDRFCWRPDLGTHVLNGTAMPRPDPLAEGLGLEPWHGCKVLGPGELVAYGNSPDSYDSRYLGIVRMEKVWGVYDPLWTS